ncbi:hypothetical protein [Natrinema sp. DC36]|uniref:hypothetical protein n=1 Tax=Natrinema sp. DC36 TaxID=2878680 RepID=UPI001CF0884D|nr:hypothetical protein [Natrinema sp. DC36]
MREEWITDPNKFEVLTKVVRETARGGILKESKIDTDELEIIEDGVNEDVFKKDEIRACPSCYHKYPENSIPEICEECDTNLDRNEPISSKTRYFESVWPEKLEKVLDPYTEDIEVNFTKSRSIEDVSLSDVTIEGNDPILHISPYFDLEHQWYSFPQYSDVFVDWVQIPKLITEPADSKEAIRNFLDTNELNASKIGDELGGVENIHYTGPGAPGPQYTSKSSWCTLLDRVEDKPKANELSKRRFGINYNEMFERLGIEFTHALFPYANTLHFGGNHVPDGLLHFAKEGVESTYLVESKCYSRDFKIFEEQDKATRYIDRFVENVEGDPDMAHDLKGYVFFACQFDEKRVKEDIHQFIEKNSPKKDLDIICMNGGMLEEGMGRLSYLYRREPSATYRIWKHTNWYQEMINGLIDFSEEYTNDKDLFKKDILETLENIGHKKTSTEEKIRDGLKKPPSWNEIQSQTENNRPEDYRVTS